MPSNHLILCHPLLHLPSIFPSIRVFSNESVLHIRWPKYWSFSFSISPSNESSGLIFFRMDWLDLLAVQGTLRVFSNTTVQSISSSALSFFCNPTLTSLHDYWKNHNLDQTDLCWQSSLCFLICCLGYGIAIIGGFLKGSAFVPWSMELNGKSKTEAYFQSRNFKRFELAIINCARGAWRGQAWSLKDEATPSQFLRDSEGPRETLNNSCISTLRGVKTRREKCPWESLCQATRYVQPVGGAGGLVAGLRVNEADPSQRFSRGKGIKTNLML